MLHSTPHRHVRSAAPMQLHLNVAVGAHRNRRVKGSFVRVVIVQAVDVDLEQIGDAAVLGFLHAADAVQDRPLLRGAGHPGVGVSRGQSKEPLLVQLRGRGIQHGLIYLVQPHPAALLDGRRARRGRLAALCCSRRWRPRRVCCQRCKHQECRRQQESSLHGRHLCRRGAGASTTVGVGSRRRQAGAVASTAAAPIAML